QKIDTPVKILNGVSKVTNGLAQKETPHYFHNFIEAIPDPLILLSSEGKINDINSALVTVSGIAKDKFIGAFFSDYFTEDEKAGKMHQYILKRGSIADSRLVLRSQGGNLIHVLCNGSVLKNDRG